MLNEQKHDDGRRKMPKMRCPFCHARLLDVADAQLKNQSELLPLTAASHADYILECPACKNKIALSIKILHERKTAPAVPETVVMTSVR